MPSVIRRSFPMKVEIEERDGLPPVLVGHAAVFNTLSRNLGGYREVIKPGAFQRAISGGQDVVALFNHSENYPLGRTSAGTLSLREDSQGLAVTIFPPDTQYARDLMVSMKRGDVVDMSFAFKPVTSKRSSDAEGAIIERHDVDLFDISPVVFPAYPGTDIAVRAMLRSLDLASVSDIADRLDSGGAVDQSDVAALEDAAAQIQELLDTLNGQLDSSPVVDDATDDSNTDDGSGDVSQNAHKTQTNTATKTQAGSVAADKDGQAQARKRSYLRKRIQLAEL